MEELAALLETAGGECVGTVLQNQDTPEPRTFLGEGKVAEVKQLVQAHGGGHGGRGQPPLPLPAAGALRGAGGPGAGPGGPDPGHLRPAGPHQGGPPPGGAGPVPVPAAPAHRHVGPPGARRPPEGSPIGTRGPGETQLETDRRHIRRKIAKLREDLEEVRRVRATQRDRREKNEVPVVAIVGYTNAGKSTLLERADRRGHPRQRNRLFDTLDTTTRTLAHLRHLHGAPLRHGGLHPQAPPPPGGGLQGHPGGAEPTPICSSTSSTPPTRSGGSRRRWWRGLIAQLGAQADPPARRVQQVRQVLRAGDPAPTGRTSCPSPPRPARAWPELLEKIRRRLDTGVQPGGPSPSPTTRGGCWIILHREARVEQVDYGETIQVTAVCTPVQLGRLKDYVVSGWTPPKEFWED